MGKLFKPIAPGPSAALEADLRRQIFHTLDPVEKAGLWEQFGALHRKAFQDPVPDEDAEWARIHRESCLRWFLPVRRDLAGKFALEAYTDSGGLFEDNPAPGEAMNVEAWRDFGDRVLQPPPSESDNRSAFVRMMRPRTDETEEETLLAALAAYGKRAGHAPPPPSEHWLAALRQVRKSLLSPEP